jgi:16S rRNA (guanine1207-N2)-methyltransferase
MAVDSTHFCTGFGEITLSRHSRTSSRKEQNLRPWDAADELLLAHLAEQTPAPGKHFLIVNDQYGALTASLTTACSDYLIHFATDSFLSQQAARKNLVANDLSDASISWHTSLDSIDSEVDYLLIKLPKTLALLEDQLYRYRELCTPNTQVIAAGLVKYMPAGVFKLFEKILGHTQTSLAKKKARLIFCTPELSDKTGTSPYPVSFRMENTDYQIDNHANVFSRESLDIGTRFFLANLPVFEANNEPDQASKLNIADLGCGNGIVGLVVAERCPNAKIDFYDESFMALASARANFYRAFPEKSARFIADDCMSSATAEHYQVILCNPPFHQQNVVGVFVAQQMFRDAKNALQQGGEFWVIGNRHLGYSNSIKRLFGTCVVVAANNKFVVLKATKR